MQGIRKTVICVAQVASCGVRTFNATPSNSVVQIKCVRGFKSAINPVKKSQLRKTTLSEKSDTVLYPHIHGTSSCWSHRCNQALKSISSCNNAPPYSLEDEMPPSLTTRNVSSSISKDIPSSWLQKPLGFPLLNCTVLSESLVNDSAPGLGSFQCRYISNYKRRSQRKKESRTLSTQQKEQNSPSTDSPKDNEEKREETEESKPTLYQRFKKTYKEHGKVLVAVHVATSVVWFGSFYTAARCGIDIVPYLESWNFSDRIISPFRSGGLGDVALAYLMYKLATPARYTVTIGGTNLAIRYLRKEGRMEPVPEGDRLRELYKEGKEDLKIRHQHRINNIKRIRSRIPRRKNRSHHQHHKEQKDTKDPKD